MPTARKGRLRDDKSVLERTKKIDDTTLTGAAA